MSKSRQFRFRDMRAAYRLLGECVELGGDPTAWRRRMLEELCRLTGASVGVTGVIGGADLVMNPAAHEALDVVDVGWTRETRRIWLKYQRSGKWLDPLYRRMCTEMHSSNGPVDRRCITRSREQLLDDSEWYGSGFFDRYQRLAQVDSRIISVRRVSSDPSGALNIITLQRALGDLAFSTRERRLLHLFHYELGPQLGTRLATARRDAASALSPRLRQTLACLLQGDSEKQIGVRLGISPHTVHDYVKRLYIHFHVQSRGELLACFVIQPVLVHQPARRSAWSGGGEGAGPPGRAGQGSPVLEC